MTEDARHNAEVRFPLSAIVGQERMKRALLLNAVHPGVGGVLIRGNKGTAKSTAVRALASVLPSIEVVRGCPYSCAPGAERAACPHCSTRGIEAGGEVIERAVRIVNLPVGASEDRLVGSLDVERALASGEQAFEPGILAAAHRGILYIDEVNLLNDHLVDVLLDAAAMGRNYVERDGLSVGHPSRFILVGTMNPEEGELRPQLLDRFGLMVEADHDFTTDERVQVVKRRIEFDADPPAFVAAWAESEQALRAQIVAARARVASVRVADEMIEAIAYVCSEHGVDGLRADIVIHRTAGAIAAWEARDDVTLDDVREASVLALAHRQRRHPFEEPRFDPERVTEVLQQHASSQRPRERRSEPSEDGRGADSDEPAGGLLPEDGDAPSDGGDERDESDKMPSAVGERVPLVAPVLRRPDRRTRNASGRHATTLTEGVSGHHVGSRAPGGRPLDLDLAATMRAAAPWQQRRGSAGRLDLRADDLRVKVREAKAAALVVFVVDASGSMGARDRMEATKGAILALFTDAYQKRDRVALITMRGEDAELVLEPTRSVQLAHRRLESLATGGRTPLWAGLERAATLIEVERRRDARVVPLVVLISDGRSNVARGDASGAEATTAAARGLRRLGVRTLVVDTETGYVRLRLARSLATELDAEYVLFDDIASDEVAPGRLAESVRARL